MLKSTCDFIEERAVWILSCVRAVDNPGELSVCLTQHRGQAITLEQLPPMGEPRFVEMLSAALPIADRKVEPRQQEVLHYASHFLFAKAESRLCIGAMNPSLSRKAYWCCIRAADAAVNT